MDKNKPRWTVEVSVNGITVKIDGPLNKDEALQLSQSLVNATKTLDRIGFTEATQSEQEKRMQMFNNAPAPISRKPKTKTGPYM